MGAAGKLRDRLRPHYSRLRFAYVPIHRHISFRLGTHTLRAFSAAGRATNAVATNDFDAFLMRATPEARLSIFRQRPFQSLSNNPWFGFDPLSPAGYEPELAHLLDYLVPDTGVFLDVGSNRGYFSIYLATRPIPRRSDECPTNRLEQPRRAISRSMSAATAISVARLSFRRGLGDHKFRPSQARAHPKCRRENRSNG